MTEPMLEGVVELGAPSLEAAIEAVLLVADEPVGPRDLAANFGIPEPQILEVLQGLSAAYRQRGSGIEVREVAGGWRLYTAAECSAAVEKFVRDGQHTRLTQASLETLAIIAYKQPISRGRIAAIRGVNVDGVVKTLLQRGLIEEAGEEHDGQSTLFRTTQYFLERMGMTSLEELPEIADQLPSLETLNDIDASL